MDGGQHAALSGRLNYFLEEKQNKIVAAENILPSWLSTN